MFYKRIGIVVLVFLVALALAGAMAQPVVAEGKEEIGLWDVVEVVGPGVWSPECPPSSYGERGCKGMLPSVPKEGVGVVFPHPEYGWKSGPFWDPYFRVSTSGGVGWYKRSSLELVRKYQPLPVIMKGTRPTPTPTPVPTLAPTTQVIPTRGQCQEWYVVQSGDYLGRIAEKFDTTVAELAGLNNFDNVDVIYIGTTICVR